MKLPTLVLALLVMAACAASPQPRGTGLTFLHLNDTYRVDAVEDGTRGGFGRVVTIIRQLREEGREVRLLHGGDFLYPSLESELWNGEQMIEAFNFMHALAPLVAVPGNHEFDRSGPERLAAAIGASDFAWVAGNVDLDTGVPDIDAALHDEYLFTAANRRIGIFGLTLVPSDGGNDRDYLGYTADYETGARAALESLARENVDLAIGLTHLHMSTDTRLADLKQEYPAFAFIVGGHEHEPEHLPGTAMRAEVMKGASNARVIWRIDVDFDADGNPAIETRTIDLDESIVPDPDYQQLADRWRERLLVTFPFLPARIGEAAVSFDAREVTLRNEESNWGNFIADQMRTAFGDDPAADLAFINSGTLRIDDYVAGDITFEDIARTFGFSSYLSYLTMTGREFRETLEAGYRGDGPSQGYFPQISGFRVCIDRSRPEGSRIAQLQLPVDGGWAEINGDREYLVVAPEYLLGGGDGYRFPPHRMPSRPGSELRYLVLDAIISAQARGEAVGATVDVDDPRIAFAPEPGAPCFR